MTPIQFTNLCTKVFQNFQTKFDTFYLTFLTFQRSRFKKIFMWPKILNIIQKKLKLG